MSAHRHSRRLLRRRLHADLSRPDVSGRRLSCFCARHGMTSIRRVSRAVLARRHPRTTRTSYDPEIFIGTPRTSSRHGRRGAGRRAVRRTRSTTNGRPAITFELYEDVPDVAAPFAGAGHADRPHLEQPSLPRVVPEPLRARRAHRRPPCRRLDHGYMKPHPSIFEAALVAGWRARRRGGDGRRQPGARHRGRQAGRDAGHAGAAIGGGRLAHPILTCL